MILLYNPLSTTPGKGPLPLSLLSLAAVLDGREAWALVDGNLLPDPAVAILELAPPAGLDDSSLLCVTVMPGPQLTQAVDVCSRVHRARPDLPIVWGGYFPTQHAEVTLRAPYVHFVVRSQGEAPLQALIATLRSGGALGDVPGLSWKDARGIHHNRLGATIPLEELPDLPYGRVAMRPYLHANYLGRRTIAYSSSFGCPFACNFCAVVAMSHRRWLAQSPARMEATLRDLVTRYGVDAVQFHDMDFFVSEARAAEFAERIADLGLRWWGLGRVDTLMRYRDATWRALARSGLVMVFAGAESASDETLAAMNKGGTASTQATRELVRRMRGLGIVPELSFVLGSPPDPLGDIARTFEFVRDLKRLNPATEIVLYTYTPVPMEGDLYGEACESGFRFPETLDEWASDRWRQLSMRRGDHLPWIRDRVRRRVRNFERVLNAYYPTVTDVRLSRSWRALLRAVSAWRYHSRLYASPLELRALQRMIRYQRPETTGF